ncbi:hypothetical protein BY996DRAFT_6581733 [Phakopsora pachyrhizi]|nr:hypothetical protein BY996DRAFT_6581733 [Phakopsora pachyrhizi]
MTALEMKSTKTLKVHKVIWTDFGNGAKGAFEEGKIEESAKFDRWIESGDDQSHPRPWTELEKFWITHEGVWMWPMAVGDGALNTGQSEDWNSTVNAPNGYISFLELMEGMGQRYITCCAAAEDRARLCELFDGLLKPGGQE